MTVLSRKSGGSGGGGAPSGPAGGDLTGTYPNPTIGAGKVTAAQVAADVATQAELDAVQVLSFWDGVVRKSADESVTSSDVLQNDDHLLFAILANTTYYFELLLVLTSASATPDLKCDFALSAGSTLNAWRQHVGQGPTTLVIQAGQVADLTTVIVFATGAATTSQPLNKINGMVRGDTNANFIFRWAQNTAGVTPTTVKAGSTLAYRAMD